MNILRKLDSNISDEDLKSIYKKGNKIAISFDTQEYVFDLNTVVSRSGSKEVEDMLKSGKGLTSKEGFIVYDGIVAVWDTPVIIDNIDFGESFCEVEPFVDCDAYGTFCLRGNDGDIADNVYEVNELG